MAQLDRNLAMELVRVTESAAISAAKFIGVGDKNGGDKAAVDGMREFLRNIDFQGTIIIGEGEKDEAPMLLPLLQLQKKAVCGILAILFT